MRLDILDSKTLPLLGLGALIHDFDHFHNDLNIARPVSSFSKEELIKYRQHPTQGAAAVADKAHFDPFVIQIIAEHEETDDGQGFPKGLVETKIDRLITLVGCANYADRLLTFEKVDKNELSKAIMIKGVGKYPLNILKAMSQILLTEFKT